jgi:hypothetical protein
MRRRRTLGPRRTELLASSAIRRIEIFMFPNPTQRRRGAEFGPHDTPIFFADLVNELCGWASILRPAGRIATNTRLKRKTHFG